MTETKPLEAGAPSAAPEPDSDRAVLKNTAMLFTGVLLLVILYYGKAVVLPVLLAVLVKQALEPMVRQLTRMHIPRALGAMLVILGVLSVIGFTAYNLRERAMGVVSSLPEAAEKLRRAVNNGSRSRGSELQQAAKKIESTASAIVAGTPPADGVARVQVEPPGFRVRDLFWSGTAGLLSLVWQGVVLTFLAYFMLASGDLYKRKIVRIVGNRLSHKRLTVEALHEIDNRIERFLWVQILTSSIVGLATWLLLLYLHVQNAAVWAIAAGVLNSIPYFGAILVSVGLGLVAFLQFGDWAPVAQAGGGAFVITSLEGMLLTPALMGKAAGINQVAMFVSLLFWGWMWGIAGTLLAVPLMMMIKTVCERVDGLQSIGELLSEN
jgi:predicted PurR-regulated permease PerM